MGTLIRDDAKIYREFFKEAAKLRGIAVKYQYLLSDKNYSSHSEVEGEYSPFIDLDVIFLEYPDQYTLKRIGWVTEHKDDKPYIMQLPFDTPNLQKGCRVTIPSDGMQDGRVFVITKIFAKMQVPDSWYCQVAPDFTKVTKNNEDNYVDSNFNYLKED